jgi:hypothetical protein
MTYMRLIKIIESDSRRRVPTRLKAHVHLKYLSFTLRMAQPTHSQLSTLPCHLGGITRLSFTPDGS